MGLNFNYDCVGEVVQVAADEYTYSNTVDVDFMYFMGITQIIPQQEKEDKTSVAKQAYMIEEMYTADEMSDEMKWETIIKCLLGRTPSLEKQIQWSSFQGALLKTLIQACGRGERSAYKRKHVEYLYDTEIAERVDSGFVKHYLMKHQNFNPFTGKMLESIAQNAEERVSDINRDELRLSRISTNVLGKFNREYGEINSLNLWHQEKREQYEAEREFAMKNPTPSEFPESANNKSEYYLDVPKAYYRIKHGVQLREKKGEEWSTKTKNVGDIVTISLTHQKNFKEISSVRTNLDTFMLVPEIKSYFEEHGYATEWTASEYIMSPGLMINLYMGAIGEEALKALLPHETIEPLPEKYYELFDFYVNGVAVDVKNYTPESYIDGKDYGDANAFRRRISWKMDKMGISKAVYVNMVDDGNRKSGVEDIDGKKVFIIGGLIDREGNVDRDRLRAMKEFIND